MEYGMMIRNIRGYSLVLEKDEITREKRGEVFHPPSENRSL